MRAEERDDDDEDDDESRGWTFRAVLEPGTGNAGFHDMTKINRKSSKLFTEALMWCPRLVFIHSPLLWAFVLFKIFLDYFDFSLNSKTEWWHLLFFLNCKKKKKKALPTLMNKRTQSILVCVCQDVSRCQVWYYLHVLPSVAALATVSAWLPVICANRFWVSVGWYNQDSSQIKVELFFGMATTMA